MHLHRHKQATQLSQYFRGPTWKERIGKDTHLYDIGNVASCLLEDGYDVVAARLCFLPNASLDEVPLVIGRYLARDEDEVADADGLSLDLVKQRLREGVWGGFGRSYIWAGS
jgi:hypothetical protein